MNWLMPGAGPDEAAEEEEDKEEEVEAEEEASAAAALGAKSTDSVSAHLWKSQNLSVPSCEADTM